MKKFEETGSVLDRPRSGRPSLDESTVAAVSRVVEETSSVSVLGTTSVRKVAAEVGTISKTSAHKVIRHNLKLYPYKLQVAHALEPADKPKRCEFARWLLNNQDIISDILWSDEAYFSIEGTINTHNCRIWTDVKPTACISKSLHSPKLCVWMGFSAEFGLQPFFFDSTVTADNYLQMLQEHVRPQLQRKRKLATCIFMQDGAPPHFATRVRNYLVHTFGDRVISRGCDRFWPPRSPDLNPLDFWFWGWLKAKIYHHDKPQSLEQLQQMIMNVCNQITREEFAAGVFDIIRRLTAVIDCDGDHFEHLM